MVLDDDVDDDDDEDEACGSLKPHSRIFLNNPPCCLYRAVSVKNDLL
jgi:hypothetical protein